MDLKQQNKIIRPKNRFKTHTLLEHTVFPKRKSCILIECIHQSDRYSQSFLKNFSLFMPDLSHDRKCTSPNIILSSLVKGLRSLIDLTLQGLRTHLGSPWLELQAQFSACYCFTWLSQTMLHMGMDWQTDSVTVSKKKKPKHNSFFS